jgi:glutamate/tyrosine decarboxylase-like PLP-dependent enzyme
MFFSKHPDIAVSVFQNAGAAYLAAPSRDPNAIISPLNSGIENSRRFRALPMYASLHAYGIQGYKDMMERQIRMARRIASWVDAHTAYTLLPVNRWTGTGNPQKLHPNFDDIFMIVLFRANDSGLNDVLAESINKSGQMYVSGTVWNGNKAVRIAIANWQVVPDRDASIVESVLDKLSSSWSLR